jgi:hypothetical protein
MRQGNLGGLNGGRALRAEDHASAPAERSLRLKATQEYALKAKKRERIVAMPMSLGKGRRISIAVAILTTKTNKALALPLK